MLLLAVYVLNLGYGFEGSVKRLGDYGLVSEMFGGTVSQNASRGVVCNRFEGGLWESVPVPLPENYLIGIDLQRWDFERKMPSYLRGEWRMGGWWYYYLYALAIKEPLGTWLLALLALAAPFAASGRTANWRDELLVWAPAATVRHTVLNGRPAMVELATACLLCVQATVHHLRLNAKTQRSARRQWMRIGLIP